MWTYISLLSVTLATVQCQTYEAQVTTNINGVESTRVELTGSLTGLRTNLLGVQNAIATLNAALPLATFNDILSESIGMMDILVQDQIGKPDSMCFTAYSAARGTIIPTSQQIFSQCGFVLNTRVVQQIVSLNTNIAALTTAAAVSRARLFTCNNIRFQTTAALFDYCITSGSNDFNTLVTNLRKTVDDLVTKQQQSITNELTTCVTNSVIASQNQLRTVQEGVKRCLAGSSSADATRINELIVLITPNEENFLSTQVANPTTASALVTTAKGTYQTNIDAAKLNVDPAVTVKALTLVGARAALETRFATTRTGFDQAVTKYSSVPAAASCVNNIRNALATTINTHMYQYLACVIGIRSGPLSLELTQIQNLYSETVAKEGGSVAACLAQTVNIAPANGVQLCRENADADEANYITYLASRAATLKDEATMVSAAGDRCRDSTFNNVDRQNTKDKQAFERCILRTTREAYTVTT